MSLRGDLLSLSVEWRSLKTVGLFLTVGALLCAAWTVAAAPETNSEPSFAVTSWRTEQGLPANGVTAVSQTPEGYIWVGTSEGLARFDGVEFKAFGLKDGLGSVFISRLFVDRQGTFWVGTSGGGISRFKNGRFETWTKRDGLAGDRITGMIGDKEGALWIWTPSGLSRFWDGRFTTFSVTNGLPDRPILSVALDGEGIVWVATSPGGLFQFQDGKFVPAVGPPKDPEPFALSMLCDHQGRLWFTSEREVLCRENGRWTIYGRDQGLPEASAGALAQLTESVDGTIWLTARTEGLFYLRDGRFWSVKRELGLSDPMVLSVFADRYGAIWAGTRSEGLCRLSQSKVAAYGAAEGLAVGQVASATESLDGTLWVAAVESGLYRRSGERFERVELSDKTGTYRTVYSVLAQGNGDLWLGIPRGVLYAKPGQKPAILCEEQFRSLDAVRAICEARDGGVWVGTGLGRVFRADQGKVTLVTEDLSGNFVTALAEGQNAVLWIATSGGLYRLSEGKTSILTRKDGLLSNQIRALHQSPDGTLWIGSRGGGLSCWQKGRLASFTTEHGLPDNSISQILQDDAADFWFGSGRHIFRVRQTELRALVAGEIRFVHPLVLGRAEGMPIGQCASGFHPGAVKTKSGVLCFPMVNGLVTIDPRRFAEAAAPARVLLEETFVDGQLVLFSDQPGDRLLSIGPGRHSAEFHYTALGGSAPERVLFKYRMEGLEDWVEAGSERLARYRNIPPGRYRFRVLACNSDGVWSETGPSLAVVVQPYFWQTWWFRGAFMLVLAGCVLGSYEWRLRRLQRGREAQQAFSRSLIESQERERKRIATDLHDSLGQDLMLINNRVTLLVAKVADPSEVTRQAGEISATTHRAIAEMRAIAEALRPPDLEHIGITKAIEWLADKVAAGVSQTRISAELDRIDGLLKAEQEIHLYRIIQEGLNNVVKHASASRAILEVKREPTSIRVSLFDNGKGFDVQHPHADTGSRTGIGFSSMSERARVLGGELDIQSDPGRGTRLTVDIPLPPDAASPSERHTPPAG